MGSLTKKHQPADQQDGIGAFAVDGQVVLLDSNDFKFDGRTLALVIRRDGSIGLEKPLAYGPGLYNKSGPRASVYGVGSLGRGRFRAVEPCTVLGRIISDGEQIEPKSRVESLASQLSLAIEAEYGGNYSVTVRSGGDIAYDWGKAA